MKNEVGFTSQGTPGSWQRPNRLFLTPQKGPAWWTDTLISGLQPLEPDDTRLQLQLLSPWHCSGVFWKHLCS